MHVFRYPLRHRNIADHVRKCADTPRGMHLRAEATHCIRCQGSTTCSGVATSRLILGGHIDGVYWRGSPDMCQGKLVLVVKKRLQKTFVMESSCTRHYLVSTQSPSLFDGRDHKAGHAHAPVISPKVHRSVVSIFFTARGS